ncbi:MULTISPECIES: hypothetical protein [Bacillus]|uniref:hypothetical protein n=1 Tax=Bacillus TaxID=1386 RepID=UPI0011DD5299|nr:MULTISPECIES: hypothetical protein [Bacillus]
MMLFRSIGLCVSVFGAIILCVWSFFLHTSEYNQLIRIVGVLLLLNGIIFLPNNSTKKKV